MSDRSAEDAYALFDTCARVSTESERSIQAHQLCPFCSPEPDRVFYRSELVRGLWDAYPVSPGHALLVTTRHVESWFDATLEEQVALLDAISFTRETVEARFAPAGYNIGVNVGAAAGQTVPHLHVHVIPRYLGDVEDPAGGVRHVIPHRAKYPFGGKTPGERL